MYIILYNYNVVSRTHDERPILIVGFSSLTGSKNCSLEGLWVQL